MGGSLNERNNSFELFPIEESLRLSDEDVVPLVILCSGQHHGLLGLQQTVEDLGCGLHLLLQGPVGHQAHVKHADEAVYVDSSVRHQPLVKLLL